MVNIFLGMFIGLQIGVIAFLIYDRSKKVKKEPEKVDLEQQKKEKELAEHYDELMAYTPEKAYKKV